ncbi:hypothetical protein M3936_19625 [Sutcliffiella horikoshii]|uniref:hypothetical protein n=1 Tax=Sutcliffiella horikoshii TaxID=79883 RepID=UPI00203EAC5D|nr:hypothetical protein [Sutcliffiella horikoshii]MCM3619785.1 hypothetical protein [Sutcliffiella horikoshii]
MKKYSFVQIYQDLIENNIVPRGIDENSIGIRRYLFCHEEIIEFAEITLKKSNVDTYSMGETANLLGIRLGDLRAFIKKGLIKKVRNDSRPRIPKIEIELFKSKFVDLNEIRVRYKFDFHPTVNSLIGKGIYPIMGPIVDGSRKYLYTRKSILQVSIKT